MMKRLLRFLLGTLRGRLILGVALVLAATTSLLIADLTVRQGETILDRQTEDATALSQALATSAAEWILADDLAGLQELVDAQREYPEIQYAVLTDAAGRALAATDASRVGQFVLDLPATPSLTVLSRSSSLVDVAAPARIGGRLVGWARVGIGQQAAAAHLAETTRNGILYALGATLFGTLIAWFMGRRITRRLWAVQETIDAVRSGNRLARSGITGTDEAAVMAREFNSMLDALSEREAELHVSEERYRSLIDTVQTAIVVHDGSGAVSDSNPQAQGLLGITRDTMTGAALVDPRWRFVREDGSDMPVSEYPVGRVIAARAPVVDVIAGVHQPGRDDVVWVIANGVPVPRADGTIDRIVVSFVDITARKRAEEAQHRLNRELAAISDCNEVLMRAVDEPALLRDICRIICDEAGYRMAWVGVAEQDGARTVRPVAWAGAEDGYLETAEVTWADEPRGHGPSGTAIRSRSSICVQDLADDPRMGPWRGLALERGYRATISLPLENERDGVFGVLAIYAAEANAFTPEEVRLLEELAGDLAFGITVLRAREEQTRLEAQLRQAQKMEVVGQLAGGIAHDFNNLLTAITGYGELLRSELPPGDEASQADLAEILAAANRAEMLTRRLLAFARRAVVVPIVLRPADVVERIAPMLRRVLGEQVDLVTTAVADGGWVRMDPGQLEQVVVNLAVNARDAMPHGGRLVIGTADVDLDAEGAAGQPGTPPGRYVELTVRDTGTGMDAETRAHLFEPFFTTKPEGKGTGLGLATVYGIVRQSGGSIQVASEVARGTTVRICLPRAREEGDAAAAAAGEKAPIPVGSETVLLVEDDPSVRGYAGRTLRGLGYTVLEAACGSAALELAGGHAGAIELLVSDIVMPGMQGTELARILRETRPALKILLISGYTDGALGDSELPPGFSFLAKPFTIEAIARAAKAALGPPLVASA